MSDAKSDARTHVLLISSYTPISRQRWRSLRWLGTLPVMQGTAHAIRKMHLAKAKRYLEDVLGHKQAFLSAAFVAVLVKLLRRRTASPMARDVGWFSLLISFQCCCIAEQHCNIN
ncbi:hypothetical protein ACFX11_006983 [Malus domestica]